MKINGKVCWLFFLTVGLVTILLPPPTLAQEEKVDLALRLVSGYHNKVAAGKDNAFFLEISNTGNRPITNIRLSADKPEGWVIEFKPGEIDYLGPGRLQTVDVNIKPAGKTDRREYGLIFIAEANEIRKVESIWVRVEPTSFWLWVGITIAAVVVAGFILVFIRFGRQ